MKGVVLAGGTGSRLDPLTKITNKHLLPIFDRPMVEYSIEALVRAGVDEIMIVTGGTHAALKRLREFTHHDLASYETDRNHPERKGTSRLSPYLHFGNIGPVTIALAC